MTWIRTLDPEEASGFTGSVYDLQLKKQDAVAPIVAAHSLSDIAFKAFTNLSKLQFADTHLDRKYKEMIGTVVSSFNECHY